MPKPVRLLYFTAETWPTFRADVAVLFGKDLPQHGVYADLVTARTEGTAPKEWGGGRAHLLDCSGGRIKRHFTRALHAWRELRRIDLSRYDAIQVRDMPLPAFLALRRARRAQVPFFYWMSYPMPEGQIARAAETGLSAGLTRFLFPWIRGRFGRYLLYRRVLPYADHVFVQSERMKADLIERGVSADRMTPVPMGVDLAALQLDEIEPADDPRLLDRKVLVYLGTLNRPRRIEILFDMLALVREVEPSAVLVLVGDTDDDVHRNNLRQRAQAAGVAEHVVWTGWLPMRVGWRYVRSADVGLSPFPRGYLLDSASPTKVPEYLALGVPVVCNDNPDQQQLVEQCNCGRCVPYTASDFACAVLELLQLPDAERAAMSARGFQMISAIRDYRTLAASLAKHYRHLTGSRAA